MEEKKFQVGDIVVNTYNKHLPHKLRSRGKITSIKPNYFRRKVGRRENGKNVYEYEDGYFTVSITNRSSKGHPLRGTSRSKDIELYDESK